MKKEREESCGECRFWKQGAVSPDEIRKMSPEQVMSLLSKGVCRAHPPSVTHILGPFGPGSPTILGAGGQLLPPPAVQGFTSPSTLLSHEWCGEFTWRERPE